MMLLLRHVSLGIATRDDDAFDGTYNKCTLSSRRLGRPLQYFPSYEAIVSMAHVANWDSLSCNEICELLTKLPPTAQRPLNSFLTVPI